MQTGNYDPLFPALMALPVHRKGRAQLRDLIPCSQEALDKMTRKFLTLASEFNPQSVAPAFAPIPKAPRYPAWLHATRQLPCLPFESGDNCLPGMEQWLADLRTMQGRG